MVSKRIAIGLLLAAIVAGGCTDLVSQTNLFVKGEPFVVRGTAATIDRNGPCLVWYGENGVSYHLFQGVQVANEDFDKITTPGVISRLEVTTRNDLVLACQVGTIVEVQRVLEIVP